MMMIGWEHIWPLVNHNFSFIQFTPAHIPLCTLPTQDIYTSVSAAAPALHINITQIPRRQPRHGMI